MTADGSDHPLVIVLLTTVPLYIADLHRVPARTQARLIREWADTAAHVITEAGDVLQYGAGLRASKKTRREVGDAINATARGIAAAAFAPGGIRAFSRVWCAQHSSGGRRTTDVACGRCAQGSGVSA